MSPIEDVAAFLIRSTPSDKDMDGSFKSEDEVLHLVLVPFCVEGKAAREKG